MPKYLIQASYTGDGTKGLMKEGGSKRRASVRPTLRPRVVRLRPSILPLAKQTLSSL